jgi:hypothetical protein
MEMLTLMYTFIRIDYSVYITPSPPHPLTPSPGEAHMERRPQSGERQIVTKSQLAQTTDPRRAVSALWSLKKAKHRQIATRIVTHSISFDIHQSSPFTGFNA